MATFLRAFSGCPSPAAGSGLIASSSSSEASVIVAFNEAHQLTVTEPPQGVELRHCRKCNEVRPLVQFRRRNKNGDVRHSTCDVCNNASRRKVRSSKRTRELGDLVERIVTAKRPGISIIALTL